jgi:Trk K+ transport system NAD-binding subunit
MQVIVVGAGTASRELLGRLGERWEATVVDPDPASLEETAQIRPVESVVGSPDEAALEAAGLDGATAVVAAADDDGVNLNVCRIAKAKGVSCVARAARPERLAEYRALDVPAVSPDQLAARRIVSVLEPRRLFSAGFAGGRAEGMDLRVVSRSPVCGVPLSQIDLKGWLAVAILRDGQLIIPHGDSVLVEGDVVTVVGEGAGRAEVVATFMSGVERFPTEFGDWVAVAFDTGDDLTGPVAEAIHVAGSSAAGGLLAVHRDLGEIGDSEERRRVAALAERVRTMVGEVPLRMTTVPGSPASALLWDIPIEDVGVFVVPPPVGRWPAWRWRVARLLRAAARRGVPVLVSRGTHPYRRVVVPARDSPAGWAAAEVAIDIGAYESCPLVGVGVIPPLFIAGDEARGEAIRAAARLQEDAAVQDVDVRRVIEQGNEVRVIEEWARPGTIVVLGCAQRRAAALAPGIVGHLVRRLKTSVILVPYRR